MKLIITLNVVLFMFITGLTQNLVQNPGFEDYFMCPNDYSQLSNCQFWNSFRGTPDYYNSCSTVIGIAPPYCYSGFQYPHSGNAFAGFYSFMSIIPNDREIIGAPLISNLIVGQKYFILFYVNLGGENQTAIASNKIGVKFSTVPYSYTNPAPINNTVHFYTDSIIIDTVKWTKISGSFIADSAYSYIMIGNFFDDSHTDTLNISTTANLWAYYFIDDICVSTDSLYCENWVGVKEQSVNKEEITIYPNPCANRLNVQINKEPYNYTVLSIIDITGKTIMQTTTIENEFVFNTEKLAKGLYLVKAEAGQKMWLTKFTKE